MLIASRTEDPHTWLIACLSLFLAEAKAKGELQPSALSLCNGVVEAGLVAELGHGVAKETARQEENAQLLLPAEALLLSARLCGHHRHHHCPPRVPLHSLPQHQPVSPPCSLNQAMSTAWWRPLCVFSGGL